MSEQIDWSKAPEGFPLWLEFKANEHRMHSGWYRKDGNYFKGYYGAHWPEYRTGQFFNVHYKSEKHLINEAYLGPVSLPPSYSGEGLPPVGVVCEVEYDSGRQFWHEAEVIYHKSDDPRFAAVWIRGHNYDKLAWASKFRPICTPEQIEARNRIAAVAEMVKECKYPGSSSTHATCEELYDAGYRKP